MSRSDRDRLLDIRAACVAIASYIARGVIDDDIVFDAIRVRSIEIGEAVKDIDPALLQAEPTIPCVEISLRIVRSSLCSGMLLFGRQDQAETDERRHEHASKHRYEDHDAILSRGERSFEYSFHRLGTAH